MSKTKNIEHLLIGAAVVAFLAFLLLFLSSHRVFGNVDKITWCHVEPNGNQETLHLPLQALEQAGHVDAKGNPLHAGDHAGACVTPSVTPTLSPTPTTKPCGEDCDDVSPTPTQEPEATPSPEVTYPQTGTDPNSCTNKDCSEHKTVVPSAPPAAGYPPCSVPNTCIDK